MRRAPSPRQYGGYGAEPDILKSRIIAEEFIAAGAPRGMAGQGISMLVPTLLEVGIGGAEAALDRADAARRDHLVPGLFRAGRRLRPRQPADQGGGGRRRLRHQRPEDLDLDRGTGRHDVLPGAHRARQAAKHEGISYLLFPMTTPGIEVRPLKTMTGRAEFNEVFFTDVRVPQDRRGRRARAGLVRRQRHAEARARHAGRSQRQPRRGCKPLIELMKTETVDGQRLIDNPVFRDRLMQLQARVLSMKFNGLRLLTASLTGETAGLARLIVKLQGCELNHQLAALAIDALGELGILYDDGPHLRAKGRWQRSYMFDLGLIIGGGTAQIQKNIISERGLGMPREPKLGGGLSAWISPSPKTRR